MIGKQVLLNGEKGLTPNKGQTLWQGLVVTVTYGLSLMVSDTKHTE